MNESETIYEKWQNLNLFTKYLHSIRFKYLIKLFDYFQILNPNKEINIVDIGCGFGKAFGLLNKRCKINYLGIDPNKDFVEVAKSKYGRQPNFRIINDSVENHYLVLKNAVL
jgi:tRNA G46 methylase TrmB